MSSLTLPDTSVVVPVYNSSASLILLAERIEQILKPLCPRFELILVDDGSSDASWSTITILAQRYPWVAGVRLAHNSGQNAATLIGLQRARMPVSVTMDSDLQHPPEALPALLTALAPQIDVVYGAPRDIYHSFTYTMLTEVIRYALALLCNAPSLRLMRTFRAMRTAFFAWPKVTVTPRLTVDGLLSTQRPRAIGVPVEYKMRTHGNSSQTVNVLAALVLDQFYTARKTPRPGHPVAIAETTGWIKA